MAAATPSRLVRAALLAVIAVAGCFPERSAQFACNVDTDCDPDRFCDIGYCVVGPRQGGDSGTPGDMAPPVDMPPDADPFAQIAQMCMTAGYSLVSGPNGLYRTVTAGTWQNAQADCKNDVANATHLIVLTTAEEVTFMATQTGWIGLSDVGHEGTFTTVTGETGDQRPFDSGQPDNGGGNENCVEMKSNAKLNDDQCGNNKRYVCECDGKMSTP